MNKLIDFGITAIRAKDIKAVTKTWVLNSNGSRVYQLAVNQYNVCNVSRYDFASEGLRDSKYKEVVAEINKSEEE